MNNTTPFILLSLPVFIVAPYKWNIEEKRTWRQRLFTLPFKPFLKTKTVSVLRDVLTDGQILKSEEGLHMNAKTFSDCKKALINV